MEKLKKPVLYGIYAAGCLILIGLVYYASLTNKELKNKQAKDDNYQYVSRLFKDDSMPVVSTDSTIIRPYTDSNVKIIKNYYNYNGTEEEQENSIINYEQTYMQNKGVAYGGIPDGFDAISVLPGTVTNVKEDNLLGTVVEIQNNDKVTTIYQGLKDVSLKQNDRINQGDIIGRSGETNMNKDLEKHIIFQLKINGKYVNPEDYYNKNINELN